MARAGIPVEQEIDAFFRYPRLASALFPFMRGVAWYGGVAACSGIVRSQRVSDVDLRHTSLGDHTKIIGFANIGRQKRHDGFALMRSSISFSGTNWRSNSTALTFREGLFFQLGRRGCSPGLEPLDIRFRTWQRERTLAP
ncbi:MAG TPA: hypothetical protein VEN78_19615, partial [Bradyrhizobium sp.]|nr:hypothetical protein [Bradyrhizobium sp.]